MQVAHKPAMDQIATETSHDTAQRQRAIPWRGLIALGGLLLAATFFMPAVPGCNAPIVPKDEVRELLASASTSSPKELSQVFVMFVAAYLWGLLVAIAAVLRLVRGSSGRREYGWGSFSILGLTGLLLILLSIGELLGGGQGGLLEVGVPLVVGLVICGGLAVLQIRALRRRDRRACLAVAFLAAVIACIWFGWWLADSLYGLQLAFVGSAMVLLGLVGEAKVVTRRSWLNTLWRLMTCRLRDSDLPATACPACGYDLRGSPALRCPECGRPFTFAELGLSSTQPLLQRDNVQSVSKLTQS